MHAGLLVVIGGVAWAWPHYVRRVGEAPRCGVERAVGYANLALWCAVRVYLFTRDSVDWAHAWPLGMCDITSFVASLALLQPRNRVWQVILYFGGIGLSTNALLTPDLREGPSQIEFWSFWLRHAMILIVAIYALAALRYRPDWNDYRAAVLLALCYAALVTLVNLPFGFNYGFLGPSLPDQPSVLDFLGPWPHRVIWMTLIIAVFWAFMVLPWRLAARRSVVR